MQYCVIFLSADTITCLNVDRREEERNIHNMSLFVVKHEHDPETCPAMDPQMAPMLLSELSEDNASKYGIKIHGEAVVNGEHTFYLIVDAPDEKSVNNFMSLFAQAGSVDIYPSSSCELVVDRGFC